jgi:predicted nucleotidyltransferase component of viral defense system
VKVDIVHYTHRPITTIKEEEGIRMYSDWDIAAMKVNAILGRGRKKDFWDIYELLHHYSLQQIIDWHSQKHPEQMLLISIPQALTYFADAEEREEPVSLKGQTWEEVKRFIQQHVNEYLK